MNGVRVGPFRLLKRLDLGGMAEVHFAERVDHAQAPRYVALKRMLPAAADDEDIQQMFAEEARMASRLDHDNICRVVQFGRQDAGAYLAMEYIHGENLRTLLKRLVDSGARVPCDVVAAIGISTARGLHHAHNVERDGAEQKGVVHRDVSPHNIMVSYDGVVKIIDFGIAKFVGQARQTQVGVLKGKVGYMAPEQLVGAPLDARSDVFALGIVLWELLVGDRLFGGGSPIEAMERVSSADIPNPRDRRPDVSKDLAGVVLSALNRDPSKRPSSAEALVEALMACYPQFRSAKVHRQCMGTWMEAVVPSDERLSMEAFAAAAASDDPYDSSAEGQGHTTTDQRLPEEGTRMVRTGEEHDWSSPPSTPPKSAPDKTGPASARPERPRASPERTRAVLVDAIFLAVLSGCLAFAIGRALIAT